jgi:hypothetical protein
MKNTTAQKPRRAEQSLAPGLRYFLERVAVPHAFQVLLTGRHDIRVPDINGCKIRILPAARLLCNLP